MKKWMLAAAAAVIVSAGMSAALAQDRGSRGIAAPEPQQAGKPVWTPPIAPFGTNVLSEDFADITTLAGAGWVQTNNSAPLGTTGWFQGNSAVFPSQAGAPTAYIGANFNNTSGAGTIDNWLITPVLPLNTLSEFSFFSRSPTGSTFPDRIQVRMNVTNTGTNTADFTVLLADINPVTTAGWTQTVINSFPGAPASGRLAFRYFVTNGGPDGANSDYIGIDSVLAVQGVAALSLGTVSAADSCASLPSNENGIIEPGEIVNLTLPVTATGGAFSNVNGVLTSNTAGVTVVSGMGNYGAIANGATANASYSVRVANTVACGSSIDLSLAVTSTEGNFSFPITRGVGAAGVITYNNVPAAIPDNTPAGVSSTAIVAGVPGPLTSVSVRVNAAHTWVGDVAISLTSPGGTTVTLLDRPGVPASTFGCSNDNINVLFEDGQPNPESVCGAGPAWPVTVAGPVTPLSALNGQNANGTWTLTISDNAAGDTGTLNSWELILNPAPAGTCNTCPSDPEFVFGVASINFGTVPTGSTSGVQFVTLSNTGDGPGSITTLGTTGPFAISGGTCGPVPIALAAGASCTIGVVFNAGAVGSATGSLNASDGVQTLSVTLLGSSILPPPAFIPVDNIWAMALLAVLMSLLAGVFVVRRQS